MLLLLLVAAASIALSGYALLCGDSPWQVPMAIHAANPSLLNRDPLITEVGAQYTSALFPLLGCLARLTSVPLAYAICFVAVRIFLVFSYYHLAYVSTRSRAVAMIAAVVLTSFTHGYLGTYLGAVPLVERALLVRSAALPLAFMALAAAIGQRHALAAVWMGLTFLFHPVTGINAFGVCLVYGILSCRTLAWRPFLLAALAVGGVIGGYVFFISGERHVPLFLDPQWRHVIDDTVGGYVFVTPEIAAKKFWATVIPGLLAVLVTRSPRLTAIYCRFAVAAGLAVAVHFLAADVAGFVPLFHCCPERASFALVAISGIGLAAMIHELWRLGRRSSRALAAALLAGLLLQLHFLLIAILFTASLPMLIGREGAGTIKRPYPAPSAGAADCCRWGCCWSSAAPWSEHGGRTTLPIAWPACCFRLPTTPGCDSRDSATCGGLASATTTSSTPNCGSRNTPRPTRPFFPRAARRAAGRCSPSVPMSAPVR